MTFLLAVPATPVLTGQKKILIIYSTLALSKAGEHNDRGQGGRGDGRAEERAEKRPWCINRH